MNKPKRITIFAGHYGSGKTNIAVNYAIRIKQNGYPVKIGDMDIVNPYFRTKDSAKELESEGIELISPAFANSNVDLPALPQQLYALVWNKGHYAVLDVGGDDRGAYALGRFADAIKAEGDYRMAFVINRHRPLTSTVEDTLEIMKEIETACGIQFTCIVNNSNIGSETTSETVLDSVAYAEAVSRATGLPIWLYTVEQGIAGELSELPILPLTLQKKYFDLPQ